MKQRAPAGWNKIRNDPEVLIWERRIPGKKIAEMTVMKEEEYHKGEWYVYATYPSTMETLDWVTYFIQGKRNAIDYAIDQMEKFEGWEKSRAKYEASRHKYF